MKEFWDNLAFLDDKFWGITIENWIFFGVFLSIGLLLRKYISLLFTKVLFRLISKYFSDYSGAQFKELLAKPVSGLIGNIFFFMALTRLLPKIDRVTIIPSLKRVVTESATNGKVVPAVSLFDLLQHMIYIGFVYYGFLLVIKIIEYVLNLRYHKAVELDEKGVQQVIPLMKDISKVILSLLAIIIGMGIVFQINVTAMIAGLGVGGIAIAFAAKESLENLIASFMVLVDKPFTIGDWIKVGDVEGVIEKVGFRSSRLRTFDKSVIIIPNRKLIDSNVENYSLRGIRRVSMTVGGIYGITQKSIDAVRAAIKDELENIEGINSGVRMWMDGFGDSQINFNIIFYVTVAEDLDFWNIKHKANSKIYELMNQYCDGFAFPSLTTYKVDASSPKED